MQDFERVRRQVNNLLADVQVHHEGVYVTLPVLVTGPQLQSVWCKVIGALNDFCRSNLTHSRTDKSL